MVHTKRAAPKSRESEDRMQKRRSRVRAAPYADALRALDEAEDKVALQVDGETVTLTRLDKLLWPPNAQARLPGYTRRDYLRHLLRVGPYMLPHLRDRPLTLIRMPDGIAGRRFVHFHYEQRLPAFVETVTIFSEKNGVGEEFLLCNNMATVLWLAHVGTLELHVWHSRTDPGGDAAGAGTDFGRSLAGLERSILNYPDYLVFDIDPYIYSGSEAQGEQPEFNAHAFAKGKEVAFRVKALLDDMKLRSIVKTSGKTGLHVLVPIVRNVDYAAARAVVHAIGKHLAHLHPGDITTDWSVQKRTGKIFMDFNMNARVKTLNVPYSVRGVAGAPVSMPLPWSELVAAQPLDYTMSNVPALLVKRGDIWRDVLTAEKQDLAAVLEKTA